MYQSKKIFYADKIEWENVDSGVKRKILGYDNNIMMVIVNFDKGGIGARHKHIHSQTTFVASGKFEVTMGEDKKVLNTGDGFYVPPNLEHGVVCLEKGELIDVFSPIREDFINNKSNS